MGSKVNSLVLTLVIDERGLVELDGVSKKPSVITVGVTTTTLVSMTTTVVVRVEGVVGVS